MRDEPKSALEDHPFELGSLCRYFSECSPLPEVAVEGATHIVRYVNPAFSRLVGKNRSELIDRPFSEAVPEGEKNGCLVLLNNVYRTGIPETLLEQEHRQKLAAYWTYTVWAILGSDERPVGVMIQVTDATEVALFRQQSMAMNESLLRSSIRQHELTENARNLNAQLQTAINHKNHFIAVLSHELRTPLTPVVASVVILRRDKRLDKSTHDLLEMIDRNVALEVRLIDDLLDMTRIERGEMNLDRRPIDVCLALEHAVEVCRPGLETGKLTLEVDSKEGPFIAEADAGRLQQVFWNLLRNAIKFSTVGGQIRVSCVRQDDANVVVKVSDQGVGIDPELLPRVFNAFQQGDKVQIRKLGGLGLGLAISKTIVELHGGTITAQSGGKGQGASFSVFLPTMAAAPSFQAEEKRGPPVSPNAVRPLRILLVDDHVDSSRALGRLMTADGHAVQWAPDIATGLKLAREQPFDLLISDLGLPDGSGLDLMRELRQQGSTLPGITLSGYGHERDIIQSAEAGFAAHLTKPVRIDMLQATICSVTGHHVVG